MLLMLRMTDEAALAKLTAPLMDVLLQVPLPELSVRACHPLCAPATLSARLPPSLRGTRVLKPALD
jgi:hypothetical protein